MQIKMSSFILPKRFSLLKNFSLTYLFFAFIIRVFLYVISINFIDISIVSFFKIIFIGLFFDIGSLSYIISMYALYLLLMPTKFHGSKLDKIITKFSYGFFIFFLTFSFLAEIPFWQEYQRRFNFISVDYLLYTYEVIENINASVPLPLLIGVIIIITFLSIKVAKKKKAYTLTFSSKERFVTKIKPSILIFLILSLCHFNIKNTQAEVFTNINESELAKSGLYSFFAAYKSNELNFYDFYETTSKKEALKITQNLLKASNDSLSNTSKNIERFVKNVGLEKKPNIIFIGLESMSASFLKRYGSTKNLTKNIDSLHKISVAFTNMYATGTRTIRGLEAISLAIPPTPGRSIVKRPNNENLFTVGEVFRQKGYTRTFFNGVDGYFDNMANYFGFNGFDVVDRRKKMRVQKELPTHRIQITDKQATFENVWGACDGDMYNILLDKADVDFETQTPFFYLLMTNSNHQPYTYPDNVIDIPSGTGRNGAIKYADTSLRRFLEKAKTKPWFKNTVFVVVADHCAYSAGRTEINVKNHHIPAFIFNLTDEKPVEINKLSSQIDVFPTLFGYLNWSYTSNLFGKDIRKMQPEDERAFIGNHRKVGLLKPNKLLILETQKKHINYTYNVVKNELTTTKTDSIFLKETISYYQTAYELFKNGGLKIKE